MAGKHSAGGTARKLRKILFAAILLVVIAAIVGAVILLGGGRETAVEPEIIEEVEMAGAEEVREAPDPDVQEVKIVAGAGDSQVTEGEEVPGGGMASTVEEVRITGAVDPADEIRPGAAGVNGEIAVSGGVTDAEKTGGESAPDEEAQPVLWLEAGAGQRQHVYVQDNPGGMAMAEFITEGDVIVASAESTYVSVTGLDDATVESLALGFTMTATPAEYADAAELFWERQGDWLILVTVLRGLDDPAALEAFGDGGLMRIVNGESYTLSEAETFLQELGYVKQ